MYPYLKSNSLCQEKLALSSRSLKKDMMTSACNLEFSCPVYSTTLWGTFEDSPDRTNRFEQTLLNRVSAIEQIRLNSSEKVSTPKKEIILFHARFCSVWVSISLKPHMLLYPLERDLRLPFHLPCSFPFGFP